MRLIRAFFKLVVLGFVLLIGFCAVLYILYKPLLDFIVNPDAYSQTTLENFDEDLLKDPKSAEKLINQPVPPVPKEAKPYEKQIRARAQKEIAKMKGMPVSGLLKHAKSLIQEARMRLNEAETKLNSAKPKDPQKQAKVAKAKQLLPKARRLLSRAESIVNSLAKMQNTALDWFNKIKAKIGA